MAKSSSNKGSMPKGGNKGKGSGMMMPGMPKKKGGKC